MGNDGSEGGGRAVGNGRKSSLTTSAVGFSAYVAGDTSMTTIMYLTAWLIETVQGHNRVQAAVGLGNGFVHIERKGLPEVTVAPVGEERIDKAVVDAILDVGTPTIMTPVATGSHYEWTAREYAEVRGSTVQTIKELFGSLSLP